MNKYLDKQALLKWLEQRYQENNEEFEVDRFGENMEIINEIKSGRFDADESEIQRLRAENERYRKALERIAEIDIPYAPMTDHSVMRFYEQVAREALASTPTEPSGAEGDGNDA